MRKISFSYIVVLLSVVFVSACSQPLLTVSKTVTPIATLTPSITPFPSLTPTATYIPITPVFTGTQARTTNAIISVENADRLTLLARWGNGNVSDVQYTPDGEYLVTAYSTGIYYYSAKDYSLVRYIDLGMAISEIAITQDGKRMAVTSADNVLIFDQGENEPTVTINETASSLAFSPDGQTLALGTYSRSSSGGFRPTGIKLFDSVSGEMILEFKDSSVAHSLTYSPDGTRLATGGYATQIWSRDGELLDTHGAYVSGGSTRSLSFSPDGALLAEGADTFNILHVWRVLPNGRLVIFRTISLGNHPMVPLVFEVAISPDGKLLAAATSNGLLIWQLSTGKLIYHKNDDNEDSTRYHNVAWSRDGETLVSISAQKGIEIWDMKNGELLKTLNSLTGAITSMAWLPNGEMIASGTDTGTIHLIDSQNGNISSTFAGSPIENNFSFSPDGNWLAIKSDSFAGDGRVVITNLADKSFRQVLAGSYGDGLSNESFSRDGKYLVTSGFENGKSIAQVWNTKDWSLQNTRRVYDEFVGQLIFCPDGETIALVGSRDSNIKFYRITDGRLIMSLNLSAPVGNAWVNAIAFSPDGQKLLTISGECETSNDCRKILRMWQTGTENQEYTTKYMKERQTLPPSPPYYSDISSSIAWSPNGELFAVGFSDGIVGVYEADNGEMLQTLNGHTLMVMEVSFSPDGQILASASLDGTIRLWSIK